MEYDTFPERTPRTTQKQRTQLLPYCHVLNLCKASCNSQKYDLYLTLHTDLSISSCVCTRTMDPTDEKTFENTVVNFPQIMWKPSCDQPPHPHTKILFLQMHSSLFLQKKKVKENLIFNPSLCSAAGKISAANSNFLCPSKLPNKTASFGNLKFVFWTHCVVKWLVKGFLSSVCVRIFKVEETYCCYNCQRQTFKKTSHNYSSPLLG